MPNVAPNSRVKRILSSLPNPKRTSDASSPRKKLRVRFDDHVRVIWPETAAEVDALPYHAIDNGEIDFTFSTGVGGDIGYNIRSNNNNDEQQPGPVPIDRPVSPIGDSCSFDGLISSHLDPETVPYTSTLHDKDDSTDSCNDATLPAPLITPPASPKRIHTVSKYGEDEEATICEWPCNLAVDIAIAAASTANADI